MEFIKRDGLHIARYAKPTKTDKVKYKTYDVIHNYDYTKRNAQYKKCFMVRYAYMDYYFIVVEAETDTVIDTFDTNKPTRDEAIDAFLDFCKEHEYKIYLEVK